jgi:TfoX/Sxy family transcriptional regulator of competence genes
MVMKKWERSPASLVEQFDRIIPRDVSVERRKMFGYPCAFVNGNMASGLFGTKMFVRLPENERKTLIDKQGATPLEPLPGRIMKEYVVVPPSLLARDASLKRLVTRSLDYAKTLAPKTKKAGKKAKS